MVNTERNYIIQLKETLSRKRLVLDRDAVKVGALGFCVSL